MNGPSLLMNILLVKIKLTRARKWTIVSELLGWLAEEGSREMLNVNNINVAPADDTTGSRTDRITGRGLVRIQWVGFVSSDHIPESAVGIGSFLHVLTGSCRTEWQSTP